jgi:hypothetical protein
MRVLKKNTHVDLATGKRTDQLIGEGQIVDIPQRWSISEKEAVEQLEEKYEEKIGSATY